MPKARSRSALEVLGLEEEGGEQDYPHRQLTPAQVQEKQAELLLDMARLVRKHATNPAILDAASVVIPGAEALHALCKEEADP